MEEEGDKILKPLFLIADPWLWALILYKPLDSHGGGHSSWGMGALGSPLCQLKMKVTFLFPPHSVLFLFSSTGRESQDFSQQQLLYQFTFPPTEQGFPSPCIHINTSLLSFC